MTRKKRMVSTAGALKRGTNKASAAISKGMAGADWSEGSPIGDRIEQPKQDLECVVDHNPRNDAGKDGLCHALRCRRHMANENKQDGNKKRDGDEIDEHATDEMGDRDAVMIEVVIARMKECHIIGKQQQQRCANTF